MAAQVFTPQYITYEDVTPYLREKITVGNLPGEFTTVDLNTQCQRGENTVEQDLGRLYLTPFQTTDGQAFANLPETTRSYIVEMCIKRAVVYILGLAFGADSAVLGDGYRKTMVQEYNALKSGIISKDRTTGLYTNIKLEGLAINSTGYTGQTAAIPPTLENPLLHVDYAAKAAQRLTSPTLVYGYNVFGFAPVTVVKCDVK